MTDRGWIAVRTVLTVIVAAGLAIDAYVHLDLASTYDVVKTSTLSQGDLFRVEAALAIVAGVALLVRPRRYTAWFAFLVSAGGVAAVLVRSEGLGRLSEVLDLALAGDTVALPDDAASTRLGALTAREITVLRMLAGGSTNAEIGTALGISPHTARTHVQKVMGKLGVRTRLGAGVVAREAGLTSGDTS
jgi:DNA-binding CsgD family transcriptional regulator